MVELSFFEGKEDMLRWFGEVGGETEEVKGERGGGGYGCSDGGGDIDGDGGGGGCGSDGGGGTRARRAPAPCELFDVVVAADVVYLNGLWNAMSYTIKVCQ